MTITDTPTNMATVDAWGIDNVSYNIGSSAIPEPSTWVMMLAGLTGLGFVGYRSKRGSISIAA